MPAMPMGRPRQHKQTARLSVSFEKADYDRVTAAAAANDVSTAWIIRKAVSAYLDAFGHSALPAGAQRERRKAGAPAAGARPDR